MVVVVVVVMALVLLVRARPLVPSHDHLKTKTFCYFASQHNPRLAQRAVDQGMDCC